VNRAKQNGNTVALTEKSSSAEDLLVREHRLAEPFFLAFD
jgi:hypothetical protein